MYELNKERFGAFVAQLRKEQGLTQQALADKLYTSNKAVSKWERGVTVPDVSMLVPLSEALGVSVTELLQGRRLSETPDVDPEELVKTVISLSGRPKINRKKSAFQLILCGLLSCLEILILLALGISISELFLALGTILILMTVFGLYFCLFASAQLPDYYDSHRISHLADGFMRIHIPGLYINNRNWPYIVRTGQLWAMLGLVLSPAVFYLLHLVIPEAAVYVLAALAIAGLFLPLVYAARKYEFSEDAPPSREGSPQRRGMLLVPLALLGVLLVGMNFFGLTTYRSGIRMGYRESSALRSWEASYSYQDGWEERRVNVGGEAALLHIQTSTAQGTLTVQVTDADGALLFSQETAEDALWEFLLEGPARVRFTLDGHSGGFVVWW